MFRKVFGAVVVMAICLSVGLAEELKGKITKISPESVSIAVFNKDAKKYADAKSYPIAKDAKFLMVQKVKGEETKKLIEGGVKASVFQNLAKEGISGTIEIQDNKVTEVRVLKQKS